MLPVAGLFHSLACPDGHCNRAPCLFSHRKPEDLPPPVTLAIPVTEPPKPLAQPPKRQIAQTPNSNAASSSPAVREPPRKLQRVGTAQRPVAVPTTSQTTNGVPVLRINAAQSLVPIPVRQTMLKTLYDHFVILYSSVSSLSPSLAADHALKQEDEVYKKSSKLTYRNAVIQCVAAIKRRPTPNSLSHPSVGTEDDVKARAERAKSLQNMVLSTKQLEPLILSREDMEKWGYMVDIPEGPGGDEPCLEGKVTKCERCAQPFQVSHTGSDTECLYHWGKQRTTKAGGEKIRTYTCCSRPVAESEGCVHGRHVFYESAPQTLHSRHAFSTLRPPSPSVKALDIAAMDCEMVYTTGGLRVARVSVIDNKDKSVFDELIRMDDDVHIIDYITRFSGITEENHSKATLPLSSIRKSLDSIINSETILVGHALDNDLRTMRMVHHKCVDTAILFPHPAGAPYRRALKDLVREKLGRLIQTGDASTGHSSAEDAAASLDLVRWHILNNKSTSNSKPPIPSTSKT
ncbi:Rexo1 protein [Macrolepiota fuliginosa MF-IS2]|uniref:Rexo1 protein n=1 Tax=Macrolepiota fuliginosa MF-IS2 TaxID=1400762 RepID=A0A9P5X946_9AGAR|nr:Rexo1 protein [Macrolepiota fuliginosa MF-IS2]